MPARLYAAHLQRRLWFEAPELVSAPAAAGGGGGGKCRGGSVERHAAVGNRMGSEVVLMHGCSLVVKVGG